MAARASSLARWPPSPSETVGARTKRTSHPAGAARRITSSAARGSDQLREVAARSTARIRDTQSNCTLSTSLRRISAALATSYWRGEAGRVADAHAVDVADADRQVHEDRRADADEDVRAQPGRLAGDLALQADRAAEEDGEEELEEQVEPQRRHHLRERLQRRARVGGSGEGEQESEVMQSGLPPARRRAPWAASVAGPRRALEAAGARTGRGLAPRRPS